MPKSDTHNGLEMLKIHIQWWQKDSYLLENYTSRHDHHQLSHNLPTRIVDPRTRLTLFESLTLNFHSIATGKRKPTDTLSANNPQQQDPIISNHNTTRQNGKRNEIQV